MFDLNNGESFSFNGFDSDRLYLKCMNLKTNGDDYQFGVSRDVEEEETNGYIPTFLRIKPNKQDITFEVVKCDGQNNPLSFTDDDYNKIRRWLFVDDNYHQLRLGRYFYDAIFVGGEEGLINPKAQGSLTFTVRTKDGLKHSRYLTIDIINLSDTKPKIVKYIKNNSEVSKIVRCNLKVYQNDKNEKPIIIENLNSDSKIIINDLKYGETCMITEYGEIYSLDDENHNLFSTTVVNNSNFFVLNLGMNTVKVTGKSKVELIYRCNYGL